MANPKFNPGDFVRLKSGGPVMTVEKLDRNYLDQWNGEYSCSWFAGAKNNHRSFTEQALEAAELE